MISAHKILLYNETDYPITADIFLTDRCNNNCEYCNYVRYEKRNGAYISKEEFGEYFEILKKWGIKGLILTGGGEPTANPDFGEICKILDDDGFSYGINTNFNIYFRANPRYLKVSLDGWDENSYKRIRGVNKYQEVINNIRRYKCEQGGKVGIQQLSTSVEGVYRFYEAHKGLNVDYMVYRPVESKGGEYYDEKQTKVASEIVRAVNNIRRIDNRVVLNYKFNMISEKWQGCEARLAQICVLPNGNIPICCNRPKDVVGNIRDDDIMEKLKQVKVNFDGCDIPCRMTGANKAIREIKAIKDKEFI